jgi:branched-chain amino acid transport system permease protein
VAHNPLLELAQHLVNGVSLGAIYALIALGYTMVYGILQLINFAHSDVFMVGAFIGYYSARWIDAGSLPAEVLLYYGLPAGLLLAALNHAGVDRALGRAPRRMTEGGVLLTGFVAAMLGLAMAEIVLTCVWRGIDHRSGGFWFACAVAFAALAYMLVRGVGLPLAVSGGALAAALALASVAFPWIAAGAQRVALGAVRARESGTVTRAATENRVEFRVHVGSSVVLVGDGDEPTVREGETVIAGQAISQKGAVARGGGRVVRVDRRRSRIQVVVIGRETHVVPESHTLTVKADQTVAAGEALSTGVVIGTPLLVLALALAGCALLGFGIERTAYRPLRHAPRINSLITAIGMSLLLENSAQLMFGADPKPFPRIVPGLAPIELASGVRVDVKQATVLLVTVVLVAVLQFIVYHTRLGLAMRAVSYNHEWAGLMGVPVDRVVSATFVIGSSLAAAAGILVGATYGKIDPLMGMLLGLKAFVAAVLGGIGNLPGALLGGLIMGLSEEMVTGYVSSSYRDAIAFAILILILLFKPAGLLGRPQVEKV